MNAKNNKENEEYDIEDIMRKSIALGPSLSLTKQG